MPFNETSNILIPTSISTKGLVPDHAAYATFLGLTAPKGLCRSHTYRYRTADGQTFTDTVSPNTPQLANLHYRPDGVITFSVLTNPARMYSVHATDVKWMGEYLNNYSGVVCRISPLVKLATELDQIDTLMSLVSTNSLSPENSLKVLVACNCSAILRNLISLGWANHTRLPVLGLSKSLYRRLVTTLKRLGILVYRPNGVLRLSLADSLTNDHINEALSTVNRQYSK